ncbi:histidine kinase [Nocardiopsis sp. RSe5-2]|uniref:Histidine kinase n=1 Tax=Nocardiopsis endophytica TaxID=3018445 RepID=A0ABT4U389_9ACTN|nr:MHYT domain-containing protein [Nocardiopsis endophytica]MDA2811161.1 histidine kinase [Nocardiopsis endophytica]
MIEHAALGWWTPALAYGVSVLGSFIGLMFATRARSADGASRWGWLVLGAVSLGGAAVWSMHFIAMMGFRVNGMVIRYDPWLTVVSAAVAIAIMAAALAVVTLWRGLPALLAGGAAAGAGVVAMHYMGMASMRMEGEMHHSTGFVAAACVIAVVAATVALWFARNLTSSGSIVAAAFVMGVAVAAMHYTGMMGVSVEGATGSMSDVPEGMSALDFLTPMILGPGLFLALSALLLLALPEEERGRARPGSRYGSAPAARDTGVWS